MKNVVLNIIYKLRLELPRAVSGSGDERMVVDVWQQPGGGCQAPHSPDVNCWPPSILTTDHGTWSPATSGHKKLLAAMVETH